jgi:hypothetical protein
LIFTGSAPKMSGAQQLVVIKLIIPVKMIKTDTQDGGYERQPRVLAK